MKPRPRLAAHVAAFAFIAAGIAAAHPDLLPRDSDRSRVEAVTPGLIADQNGPVEPEDWIWE